MWTFKLEELIPFGSRGVTSELHCDINYNLYTLSADTFPYSQSLCTLVVLNLLMHYYYCVTVQLGFVDGDGDSG